MTMPRDHQRDEPAPAADGVGWLAAFHRGEAGVLERCYREHFATVERAIGPLLGDADRETVIHELFSRLLAEPELRRAFRGGTIGAWLATVARNQAIDFRRRLGREVSAAAGADPAPGADGWESAAQARLLVERFRRELLPAAWAGVFELRFLAHLPQRQAAQKLGIHRTTLAYRELCIRRLLRRFLLDDAQTDENAGEQTGERARKDDENDNKKGSET
jgi:RNA polymerase sigma-70 factor, ECF subfamily